MALETLDRAPPAAPSRRPATLPPAAAPPRHRQLLVDRFRLTIPLRKPLVVRYLDPMETKVVETAGLPLTVLADVIHILVTPRQLAIVPIAQIIDIRPLYPEAPHR